MTTTEKRIALVTGASRGIGASIAQALSRQGRHVVLLARNSDKLASVLSEITAAGGSGQTVACDIADGAALAAAVDKIADEHKRLDIVVNNAGITRDNLMLRMSDEEFDTVMQTNLRSVFVACRAALRPMMRGKWGRIVNISSVAGLIGNAGQANYAATKAGVIAMTKCIAKEMAAKQITANCVCPGFVQTDMTDVLPQQVKDLVSQHTPLKRFGQPHEIAAAVAYLTSDDAGYITGQTITVDGGMTMC